METVQESFSELSLGSEVVTGNGGRSSGNLITDNELPSSVQTVLSDDNLLIEILLRLPILSLLFFKSVSKHWLSLIRHISSTSCRTQNPYLDPPTGLYIRRSKSPSVYDFVSLDSRIPSRSHPSPFTFTFRPNSEIRFEIYESCNGLLLCEVHSGSMFSEDTYCVYNPSAYLFKMLPKRQYPNLNGSKPIMTIAFDPRKSPHYKVILIGILDGFEKIEIYSSETGNWSVCGDRFPRGTFLCFRTGIYWNYGIHWLGWANEALHFKLDIVNDPILTKIQLPLTMDTKRLWDWKLFESRDCLLLLSKDSTHPQQFNIYEICNGSPEWSTKYILNLDGIIDTQPWTIIRDFWCIVLGEKEEDAFMVIQLDEQVVEYKLLSKNLRKLYDLGSIGHVYFCFQFNASLALCSGPEHEGTCSRENDALSSVLDSLVPECGFRFCNDVKSP